MLWLKVAQNTLIASLYTNSSEISGVYTLFLFKCLIGHLPLYTPFPIWCFFNSFGLFCQNLTCVLKNAFFCNISVSCRPFIFGLIWTLPFSTSEQTIQAHRTFVTTFRKSLFEFCYGIKLPPITSFVCHENSASAAAKSILKHNPCNFIYANLTCSCYLSWIENHTSHMPFCIFFFIHLMKVIKNPLDLQLALWLLAQTKG